MGNNIQVRTEDHHLSRPAVGFLVVPAGFLARRPDDCADKDDGECRYYCNSQSRSPRWKGWKGCRTSIPEIGQDRPADSQRWSLPGQERVGVSRSGSKRPSWRQLARLEAI